MPARLITAAAVALVAVAALAGPPKKAAAAPKEVAATPEMLKAGEAVFNKTCIVCHQKTGKGLPPLFPPLAGSDFLMADKKRSIGVVLKGQTGPITVNGKQFNQIMPPLGQQLSDEEIAHVLTFVRNSWENKGDAVVAAEVAAERKALGVGAPDAGVKK